MQNVAPLAGAWIEISRTAISSAVTEVAPLAGAWIEIVHYAVVSFPDLRVAPLAGAWIEIQISFGAIRRIWSLPLRERGLKFDGDKIHETEVGRSPCGSVD